MRNEEMLEGNKLIAEFMGFEFDTFTDGSLCWFIDSDNSTSEIGVYMCRATSSKQHFTNYLLFNSSWDWLMPVVEKTESLGFEVNICERRCLIMNNFKIYYDPLTTEKLPAHKRFETDFNGGSKIECTYLAVIEFIKWYNTQLT